MSEAVKKKRATIESVSIEKVVVDVWS